MSNRPIYLDSHATTPVDERVEVLPYFTQHFGNPSSVSHLYGWEAEAAATRANCWQKQSTPPEEIVFTSGATGRITAIKGWQKPISKRASHHHCAN